jgi:hypothetical protein
MKSLKPDTFYLLKHSSYFYIYRMLNENQLKCYLRMTNLREEIVKRDYRNNTSDILLSKFVELSREELIELIGPKTKETEEIYELITISLSDTINNLINKLESYAL